MVGVVFTFSAGGQFGEGACGLWGCFWDASNIPVLELDGNYMGVCFVLVIMFIFIFYVLLCIKYKFLTRLYSII